MRKRVWALVVNKHTTEQFARRQSLFQARLLMFQLHVIQAGLHPVLPYRKMHSLKMKCVKAMADFSFRLYTVGVSHCVYVLDMYCYRSW